jgi:hypothetical protein
MKPTKENTETFVRHMLATDDGWAIKALVRIFQENQTPSEQSSGSTTVDNGIGFTGVDAQFLSSLAQAYLRYSRLSPKQLAWLHKKMPKYHGQVIKMSDPVALSNLVTNYNPIAA